MCCNKRSSWGGGFPVPNAAGGCKQCSSFRRSLGHPQLRSHAAKAPPRVRPPPQELHKVER